VARRITGWSGAAKIKVGALLDGPCAAHHVCRALHHGSANSPISKVGLEVTDSPYVVANMRIMARIGKVATDRLGNSADFVPGLHSLGDLDPLRRYIVHFRRAAHWSVGLGYGGNALLGKSVLRCASPATWRGNRAGWPSTCSSSDSNRPAEKSPTWPRRFPALAEDEPGDDGLRAGEPGLQGMDSRRRHRVDADASDGYLHAINPEADSSAWPGHGDEYESHVMRALNRNTIFTNVGDIGRRAVVGRHRRRSAGRAGDVARREVGPLEGTAAHPNARYTVPAQQSPCISPNWEAPEGVPISAIIFGGRRGRLAPLVYESFDWQHGVFRLAHDARNTAATTGDVASCGAIHGDAAFLRLRHGDYFRHWLEMGKRIPKPPKIFHVNWFRRGANGKFLWPGMGKCARAEWIWSASRDAERRAKQRLAMSRKNRSDAGRIAHRAGSIE